MKESTLLTLLVFSCTYRTGMAVPRTSTYKISDLLDPQLNLQFILRIPESYSSAPTPSSLITQTIHFLTGKRVPFHLFYNNANSRSEPLTSIPSRYLQNQVAWLVFVTLEINPKPLDLNEVLQSSSLGTDLGLSNAVHKHWIELMVDETGAAESWTRKIRLNIFRTYVPMYFILFFWSGVQLTPEDVLIVRDTCLCDDHRSVVHFQTFFDTLGSPMGRTDIAKEIESVKKDFRGRRVVICSSKSFAGTWEQVLSQFLTPYSFRTSHAHKVLAFLGIFDPLISEHNVTIDLNICPEEPEREGNNGVIQNESLLHMQWCCGRMLPPTVVLGRI